MRIKNLPPDYGSIEDRRSSTFGKKTPQPTPGRGPDYTQKNIQQKQVINPESPGLSKTRREAAEKTQSTSSGPRNRYSHGGQEAKLRKQIEGFKREIRNAHSASLRNINLDRSYDAGAEERGRIKAVRAEASQALQRRNVPVGAAKYQGKGGGAADSGRVNTVKSSGPGGGAMSAPSRTAPSRTSSYGGGARDSGGASKSTPARGTERFAKGSLVKSKVNQAGTYTKPGMRKKMFESIKASAVQGTKAGQWSARKAQLLAKRYKASGGGYK